MLLHLSSASFLRAAQMCFYPVKRKSRLKPAMIAQFFLKPRRGPRITLPPLQALRRAGVDGTDEALAKASASWEKDSRKTVCVANRSAPTDSAYGGF